MLLVCCTALHCTYTIYITLLIHKKVETLDALHCTSKTSEMVMVLPFSVVIGDPLPYF
jgi:hypothetical protein